MPSNGDTNAKEEIEGILKQWGLTIKCASISYGAELGVVSPDAFNYPLYVDHSESVLKLWLDSLNFDYDSGFGGQHLFGILWFTDGTWASRGEYDGSEWWEHNRLPDIPPELFLPFPVGNQK